MSGEMGASPDYRAGRVDKLRIGATLNLWIRGFVSWMPPSEPVEYFLEPNESGSVKSPENAYGPVSVLNWGVLARQIGALDNM